MFLYFYMLRQAKEVNDAMKVILPRVKKIVIHQVVPIQTFRNCSCS